MSNHHVENLEQYSFSKPWTDGTIQFQHRCMDTAELKWHPHPKYQGVYLKHLVTGAETEGQVSCHLVMILPHHKLDEHVHDQQWELHEVLGGAGRGHMTGVSSDYRPGAVVVIPSGTTHGVLAGDDGLVIGAKFLPALV